MHTFQIQSSDAMERVLDIWVNVNFQKNDCVALGDERQYCSFKKRRISHGKVRKKPMIMPLRYVPDYIS